MKYAILLIKITRQIEECVGMRWYLLEAKKTDFVFNETYERLFAKPRLQQWKRKEFKNN